MSFYVKQPYKKNVINNNKNSFNPITAKLYMSFYEKLGVPKTATETEIKKAFRSLSLQYHPDRNPESDAQHKFQEINEAYETLSQPNKREQYDMEQEMGPMGGMMGGGMGGMHMHGFPPDIFNMMFGGGMGGIHMGMGGMGGPMGGVRIFHGGMGGPMGGDGGGFFIRKPQNIRKVVKITLDQCYHGEIVQVEIERVVQENNDPPKTEKCVLSVQIPKGIKENEVFVIREQGSISKYDANGGMVLKSDVEILFETEPHANFVRQDMNIVYKKNISLKEALCGCSFEIKLFGKLIRFNKEQQKMIIHPNEKKTIPDLGMVREGGGVPTGSFIIEFHIDFPAVLNDEQRAILAGVL